MAVAKQLQLVVVTPERKLLDERVESLRFPLVDGQIGVLPGRAALVGRLGYGELSVTTPAGSRSYFIDGGFVQIKGSVVSLLTDRAIAAGAVDRVEAEELLRRASEVIPTTDSAFAAKDRDQQRARRMLAMAAPAS